MNVLIINSNREYDRMWEENGHHLVSDIDDADIVQFTGGEDVTPHLYGEAPHPKTHYSTVRDAYEEDMFHLCLDKNIPMVGICRGGQFLNVMCRGGLWQDVNNHAIAVCHSLVDLPTGRMIDVSSTHHQMMRPSEAGVIIGVASESTWKERVPEYGEVVREGSKRGEDIEVVFYPEENVLCFQPHPEFFEWGHPCQRYYFELINDYIGE